MKIWFFTADKMSSTLQQSRSVLQIWSNLRLLSFVQNPQEEMICVHQQGVWNFLLSLPSKKRKHREKPYLTATKFIVYFHKLFLNLFDQMHWWVTWKPGERGTVVANTKYTLPPPPSPHKKIKIRWQPPAKNWTR